MKTKYYTKLLLPLCLFCCLFRFLQLSFAVEYSVDSYFYINGSIIPLMFSVFISVCVLFFLSYWCINLVKGIDFAAKKEKAEKMKAAKAAGKEAYKAFVEENKKDAVLVSEFSRMKKLDGKTTLLYVLASVLILAHAAQLFLGELEQNLVTYAGIGDVFKSLITYIFITAILSVLFFVQFSSSPKAASKGKFWMIISFAPALFYTLLVFYTFRIHSGIISKVFVAFDFMKIVAIGLALICIPQLFASSRRKDFFFSASLCAVFLSTLRLTDGFVSVLVSMGLGDSILPIISHLDKIEIDPMLALGDFFLSFALMLTAIRVCKKPKKKQGDFTATEAPASEPVKIEEEPVVEAAPIDDAVETIPEDLPSSEPENEPVHETESETAPEPVAEVEPSVEDTVEADLPEAPSEEKAE